VTISTTEGRILYLGNGSTTSFAVPFDFDASTDIKVESINTGTNAVTLKELTSDYSISGTNVVFTQPPSALEKILLTYNLGYEQVTNYVANAPFAAETTEDAFDERVKQIKQLAAEVKYNVPKLPANVLTDTTVDTANLNPNYGFTINGAGTGIALQDIVTILDIETLTTETPVLEDYVIISDTSNAGVKRKATLNQFKNLFDSTSVASIFQIDGITQSTGIPTFDFDGTDFTIVESLTDDFDIKLSVERIQDISGAMVGGTQSGITVSYDDGTGLVSYTVDIGSETTVGLVELATAAETNTGTSQALAVTPYALENWSGSTNIVPYITMTAGEDLVPGDFLYTAADGLAYKSIATGTIEQAFVMGAAITTTSTGNPVDIRTSGIISSQTSLTVGDVYYLDSVAGSITDTPPGSTGDNVVRVGLGKSATEISLMPQFICVKA
jgi:hypothetical protein